MGEHCVNEQERWRGVRGFNYQPSYGRDAVEIWVDRFHAESVARELGTGRQHFPGMNTVRLWLSHDAFLRDRAAFSRNLETVLDLCDRFGLKAIVTLFNHWHSIPDFGGIALEMIQYWFVRFGQRGQAQSYVFRPYLEATFGAYAEDPRILAWDMCNEPHLDCDGAIRDWLQHTYDTGKAMGVKAPIGVSVNVSLELLETVEPFSDVLMVHPYHAVQQPWAELQALARRHRKALLVTECCWGSLDDGERVEIVRSDLGVLSEQGIGFLAHALCESRVADLHRPDWGPVSGAGYMGFVHRDGSLRAGHEVFNEYAP